MKTGGLLTIRVLYRGAISQHDIEVFAQFFNGKDVTNVSIENDEFMQIKNRIINSGNCNILQISMNIAYAFYKQYVQRRSLSGSPITFCSQEPEGDNGEFSFNFATTLTPTPEIAM